jgi:predicted nuclease of predicted toxin-antitoxin system
MKKKDPTENQSQLGNLLLRYKTHFRPPQASVERECILVIKDITGIDVGIHQITYNVPTQTIILKTPSLVTSELKTKYSAILSALQKRLNSPNPPKTII